MPSFEEDIIIIRKQLDKMLEGSKEMTGVVEMIETLATYPMSIEMIKKTRIGLTLNALRKKTGDEKIAKKSKTLIREWKNLVKEKASTEPGRVSNKSVSYDANGSRSSSETTRSRSQGTDTLSGNKPSSSNQTPSTVTAVKNGSAGKIGEVRMKAQEMMSEALRSDDLPDGTHNPEELAAQIEEHMYQVYKDTGMKRIKYRAALRSRVSNLRDKKNPALRENVLTGVITTKKFATMSTEEMASDEVRKMREQFTKESIEEHQMSIQAGTPSDMFKCGKCKNNICTYTQLQTRSADEPMTTFVFCRTCGNRWKLN